MGAGTGSSAHHRVPATRPTEENRNMMLCGRQRTSRLSIQLSLALATMVLVTSTPSLALVNDTLLTGKKATVKFNADVNRRSLKIFSKDQRIHPRSPKRIAYSRRRACVHRVWWRGELQAEQPLHRQERRCGLGL